jgi:hypothetical protein
MSEVDNSRFDDIYDRINDLTVEVNSIKVQTSTYGTQQVAIAQLLTLATGLAGDMRQVKSDIRELKANARNTDASINEILRLLRSRE